VKNDAATQAQKTEFQNKLLELQQVFMKEQQELQSAEAKQLGAITEKMKKIVAEIGQQGGYTIILEIQDARLLFAKPHLDLTNEVIRKYNVKFK
jgi:Skp family chaperone for outer membrane proteins